MNSLKRCPKCGKDKVLAAFGVDLTKANGHRYVCKACIKVRRIAKPGPAYERRYHNVSVVNERRCLWCLLQFMPAHPGEWMHKQCKVNQKSMDY